MRVLQSRPPVKVSFSARGFGRALLATLVLLGTVSTVHADAASLAKDALSECTHGRENRDRAERLNHFKKGEELARQAIAADDKNANAHFALFCNLGEAKRIDGESVQALVNLGTLMSELDRTIELDPNHADALAAKGTLLVKLPKVFGGDTRKGETMLRRVLELDPNAFTSRLSLAQVCQASSRHDEAVTLTNRALEIAKNAKQPEKVAEAEKVLTEIGAKP